MSIETIYTWDTQYSADSVEWCPALTYSHFFVCGTYHLEEKRLGRLMLFCVTSQAGLTLLQTIEMSGILDVKWCHRELQGKAHLAVVNSSGRICLYHLDEGRLSLVTESQVAAVGALALSLDWSTGVSSDEVMIAVSDSRGIVRVLSLECGKLAKIAEFKANEYEAWITAFNYWNTSVVYTGGDDSLMKTFDMRRGIEPVWTCKEHETGVTSIHSNVSREYCLATGSYDERLRIWDTRSTKAPRNTTALGGGVWRLKWDPCDGARLVAACMLAGVKVVNEDGNILAGGADDSNLLYGADWNHLTEVTSLIPRDRHDYTKPSRAIATCSFYNHKLTVSIL